MKYFISVNECDVCLLCSSSLFGCDVYHSCSISEMGCDVCHMCLISVIGYNVCHSYSISVFGRDVFYESTCQFVHAFKSLSYLVKRVVTGLPISS